jgi:hypothetical protein
MQGLRVLVMVGALCASACTRRDTQLEQHSEAFQSLSSTTKTVVQSWLDGKVSGTYALTALDQTYMLVEQERTSLTSSASTVIDPRGAAMSDSSSELARRIAEAIAAVRRADGQAARQHLNALPFNNES